VDKHFGACIRMRRLMFGMSHPQSGEALGLTFRQVQKCEKGSNRVGASKLRHIASILQVPLALFFEGAPNAHHDQTLHLEAPLPVFVTEFLATNEGPTLVRAFTKIKNPKFRRRIINLAKQISE
jgi:transcriptional regulator with XRE-family HTH domain